MCLSCTVSEILQLISQNLKRSRDPEHIPFGGNLSFMHLYFSVSISIVRVTWPTFTSATLSQRGYQPSSCVCLSVTRQYCIKMAKCGMMQTTPRYSPGTQVFWCKQLLVDNSQSTWNLHSKWPIPFLTPQFLPISAHNASNVKDGKNV